MLAIHRKPQGAVLAVGLMLLLVVSMTAIIAMSGAVMQEKMVGSVRNESIADASVETALRDGERWLWEYLATNARAPTAGTTSFVVGAEPLLAANDPLKEFRSGEGWNNGGTPYRGIGSTSSNPISNNPYQPMAQVPRYIVEYLGDGGNGVAVTDFSAQEGTNPGDNTHIEGGTLLYYRISARGTGGADTVVRAAESVFTVFGNPN